MSKKQANCKLYKDIKKEHVQLIMHLLDIKIPRRTIPQLIPESGK